MASLRKINRARNVRGLTVRDVMKKPVIVIGTNNTIREAAKKMVEKGIGSLVVIDSNEEVVGIVTERDLAKAIAEGIDLESPVTEIMSDEVFTVAPETSVLKAIEMMKLHNIRHLPVVEDDKLIGIVSLRDLAYAAVAEMIIRRILEVLKEELEEI